MDKPKQVVEFEIDVAKTLTWGIIALVIVFVLIGAFTGEGQSQNSTAAPREFDITNEADRMGVRDQMIRQGTTASDAEEFTRALSDAEKEWRQSK